MNIFGKACSYFVINKKLSLLLFIGIIFWGSLSFVFTPKQYNPEITAPAFNVIVDFPGATNHEVNELVTKPLEDVIHEIPGVDEIFSQSHHGGRAIVTVQFDVGEDFDTAKIRLRQRISTNMDLSPLGITNILIQTIDPDDIPVLAYAFYSDTLKPEELRKRVIQIKDQLKLTENVSHTKIYGSFKSEYQINLDPIKLKESKTSTTEVSTALNNSSLLRVLGVIKDKTTYIPIETTGAVKNISDIEDIVIVSNVDQKLKIKDIAKVTKGYVEDDLFVRHYVKNKNHKYPNAILLSLAKQKGANITVVTENIKNKLKKLEKESKLFKNLSVDLIRDEGRVANEEISGLTINLIQAIAIVFIILFYFLNVRAAIIVATTIPVTLLTVIGIGNLAGMTINRITLFALILSLGMLVDSATVVVENIVRNKMENPDWSKLRLITTSVSEVGMGLFLSTLTTVLAFIPMKFVTGMMGPYMGPLPFFVSAALIVSLVYSYTIVPWLASLFCKYDENVQSKSKNGFSQKIAEKFMVKYKAFITNILNHRKNRIKLLAVSFFLVMIVMTFPIFKLLRFRMLPKADREQIYVYLDLNNGTNINQTLNISDMLVDHLKKHSEIKSIQAYVGTPAILDFNGMFKGSQFRQGTHQATLKLNLTHPDNRKLKSEELAVIYRKMIREKLVNQPSIKFQIVEDPPGPPVQSTFYVKVKTKDEHLRKQVTLDLAKMVSKIKGVEDIDTTVPEDLIKETLVVDTEKAALSQVSTANIAETLSVLYTGKVIGVYHDDQNLEQVHITLKFPKEYRDDIKDLNDIFVINRFGNPVPVARLLKTEIQKASQPILNDNRELSYAISAEMENRSITYAAIDLLKKLYDYNFSGKLKRSDFSLFGTEYKTQDGETLKIEIGGEWEMTLEVFRDLGLAMMIAIILIYLALVAQFRSYLVPVLILGTIPLALVGVFPGFAFLFTVSNIYFSATSMIGVIALAGIVVNNAIILLEYINQLLDQKVEFKEAIIQACTIRMRPILLTSMTTILGSLAIAGDPVWAGLAWSVVFGLSLSALLTLVVFPTLVYSFYHKKGSFGE